MKTLTKKQAQRRRDWLNDILLDATGDGNVAVISACKTLSQLHPCQWENHPAYAIAKAHVIDVNPLN